MEYDVANASAYYDDLNLYYLVHHQLNCSFLVSVIVRSLNLVSHRRHHLNSDYHHKVVQ